MNGIKKAHIKKQKEKSYEIIFEANNILYYKCKVCGVKFQYRHEHEDHAGDIQ